MNVMYVIVPLALIVVGAAVAAYVWAARDGQFDDLTTPALRALHDEPPVPAATEQPKAAATGSGQPGRQPE